MPLDRQGPGRGGATGDGGGSSLLARHLRIVDHERAPGTVPLSSEDAAEAARCAALPLPPLSLATPVPEIATAPDKASRRWLAPGLAGVTFAAALVLLALPRGKTNPDLDHGFTAKGDSAAWVYAEQDGQVHEWHTGERVGDGAKVGVKVQSARAASAALLVMASDGRLLSTPSDVAATALTLAAASTATFPDALQLTGPSEGETLAVVVCPEGAAGMPFDVAAIAAALAPAVTAGVDRAEDLGGPLAGCTAHLARLR